MSRLPSNAGYGEHADHLLKHYDAHSFEEVHASVLSYFPAPPSTVLDIGCGSGRDAAHFAAFNEFSESVQAENRRLGVGWTKLVFIKH